MGISSKAIISEAIQLCVFDLRRGQQEGQEIDKILFFFPADCPYSTQLSVLGLSEGLITFTRIFSPDAPCEVIEAEKHTNIFYPAEPDIWMVLIVEKNKDPEAFRRSSALNDFLKELHNLFLMFHGPVRALLDKDPIGVLARNHLYPFIADYLTDFLVGKKFQIPSFRDSLKERGTVRMHSLERDVAIDIQSLVTVLESSCPGNTLCKSLILFQDLLVSTTLPPDDTTNLYTYAVMRLTQHALSSGSNSWSYLRKGISSSNVLPSSISAHSGFISENTSHDSYSLRQGQISNVTRPLQHGKWFKGNDGFLTTDAWRLDSRSTPIPNVWLTQIEEQMYLCIFQHKSLTIILTVPVCSLINGEDELILLKEQILDNASRKIIKVEEKLSQGWGGENTNHVKGYRYLLLNTDQHISKASPPGKVSTLSKESLLTLNKLRVEVDLEKSRSKLDDPEHELDLEVCIRAKNNAWVISKVTRGNELYMVLEKASETLLYASDAVDKFTSRYCNGVFSLD
ncbi:hypothetical protein ZOSMA_30G00500 [Zostera marina]|uniref:CCZ1/INTU/HSP4 first Longin domain-containing protein n=1 Tax=Zostera marina TaxID=29655 RepID=A0A0K9P9X7_ZOSMR|nr:hypothetical protein ZOSMA_30G00500 [Zostera marina]